MGVVPHAPRSTRPSTPTHTSGYTINVGAVSAGTIIGVMVLAFLCAWIILFIKGKPCVRSLIFEPMWITEADKIFLQPKRPTRGPFPTGKYFSSPSPLLLYWDSYSCSALALGIIQTKRKNKGRPWHRLRLVVESRILHLAFPHLNISQYLIGNRNIMLL
jgi:hypothetical protein